MKIKYSQKAINKCNNEIKALMLKIIETKIGGTTKKGKSGPARVLNSSSGDLKRNIKPVIEVKGDELFINIEMVEYYQYLDEGTKRIKKPWFLTDELMNQSEFLDSIAELTRSGIEETIIEVFSKL